MKDEFKLLQALLPGEWKGEGFAQFPTIQATAYREVWRFEADADKDAIHFAQKTWYKNQTGNNGKTVFWDTGFILLKEETVLLVSAQAGGRLETYELAAHENNQFVFNTKLISNDPKTIRSQRVLRLGNNQLEYSLNMSTKEATDFQNHLKAMLQKA
jgi:hypothetical protein